MGARDTQLAPPPVAPPRLLTLSHPSPEPHRRAAGLSAHLRPNSDTPDRYQPSARPYNCTATAQNGRETAGGRRKSAAARGGRPKAPAGAIPGEPRAARAVPGRSGCSPSSPVHLRPTRTGWPAGGGQVVSRQMAADSRAAARRRAEQPTGRPPRGSRASTGGEGARTGPARHLASAGCAPGHRLAPASWPAGVGGDHADCRGRREGRFGPAAA